jgi:nicotinamidase-related amidase
MLVEFSMSDLVLDAKRTALISIDLQNGIVGLPVVPHAAADVVSRVAQLADALRDAGGLVVFVTVANSTDGADALAPILDNPPKPSPRPADWADLAADLGAQPGDLRIVKRQWGAFYGTELDLQLRRRGIGTLLLTGIATNVGVESTARDAFERGYNQVFVEDAMSAMGGGHASSTTSVFPRIGRLRTTEAVLTALRT